MIPPPDRPRAASAVFRAQRNEILLVKHRWRDGTISWILPGGALLSGEKPEEAALRELYEETGLKGKIVRFLFIMPYELGTSATFLVLSRHLDGVLQNQDDAFRLALPFIWAKIRYLNAIAVGSLAVLARRTSRQPGRASG